MATSVKELANKELRANDTRQIVEWLRKKGETKRAYAKYADDFEAILILVEAGFHEQADQRFASWKQVPLPAELLRFRLAVAALAGGKKRARQRFNELPAAAKKHAQLEPWRNSLKSSPLAFALLAAGILAVGLTQVDWSQEKVASTVETPAETPAEKDDVAKKLAALEKEVEQLKQENDSLKEEDKPAPKPEKEKKREASEAAPKQTLESAIEAVQSKDYEKADGLLRGKVLTSDETAGMARFYQLIARDKLKKTKQSDYVAYREDFPESGYTSDVLWMQAVHEQKQGEDYKATLRELAKQPDNEWSIAAKAILAGKSTLGD